jgi:hypothetical protein
MLTRDTYIALLEKRAMAEMERDGAPTTIPPNDSREEAMAEASRIKGDNRKYLGELFNNAGEVEREMTSAADKIWGEGIDGERQSSNPFIKMARQIFLAAMDEAPLLKTASPIHAELAFNSFLDELSKIAALKPQTLAQLQTKNQVAMQNPKTWHIGGPAGAGGAAAAGSGTSVHTGGLMGRLSGLFGSK